MGICKVHLSVSNMSRVAIGLTSNAAPYFGVMLHGQERYERVTVLDYWYLLQA